SATFAGVTRPPTLLVDPRFPINNYSANFSLTNKVSKVMNAHTVKAGIYVDRLRTTRRSPTNFNGTFAFGRDTNNPYDTGYAYSNALMGVFSSYVESISDPLVKKLTADGVPNAQMRAGNIEWFVQDNWRVTRRLTLD